MPLPPPYCHFQPRSVGEPAGSTRVRHISFLAPGQCLLPGCWALGLGQAVCDPGPWHPGTDATFNMLIEDIMGWHEPSLVRDFIDCIKCHVFLKSKKNSYLYSGRELIGVDKRVETEGLILCIAHGPWLSPFHL